MLDCNQSEFSFRKLHLKYCSPYINDIVIMAMILSLNGPRISNLCYCWQKHCIWELSKTVSKIFHCGYHHSCVDKYIEYEIQLKVELSKWRQIRSNLSEWVWEQFDRGMRGKVKCHIKGNLIQMAKKFKRVKKLCDYLINPISFKGI